MTSKSTVLVSIKSLISHPRHFSPQATRLKRRGRTIGHKRSDMRKMRSRGMKQQGKRKQGLAAGIRLERKCLNLPCVLKISVMQCSQFFSPDMCRWDTSPQNANQIDRGDLRPSGLVICSPIKSTMANQPLNRPEYSCDECVLHPCA